MFKKYQKPFLYLLIPFLCFVFIFIQKSKFTSFKLAITNTLSIPIRIVQFPLKELKKILYYHRTFEEYKRLRSEVNVLKARLVGLEEVIRENTRFEQLLNFKRDLIFSSIMANVTGRDPTNWNASITIDKGTDAGLAVGMPVVNASGVVGKIAEVSQKSSRVILINDPQFSVAALVQRPRETGLLSGTLQGNCRLLYLATSANVEVGDKVITSKLSSSFPEGLMIGEIIGIRSNRDKTEIEYIVQPTVALSKLEEVLVIQK